MSALREHWTPRLIHTVLDRALDRCGADLDAMFMARGIYKCPDIRLLKANYADMQEWHQTQMREGVAGTFNWYECLERIHDHPMAQKYDALVAIKSSDTLAGLVYFRYHPDREAMYIMQVERLAGNNPLKGNFSFVYLNAAVSLAHALDIDTIKLAGPFYWNAATEQKIRGLGFQNDENGDMVARVPLWAKGFSYSRYNNPPNVTLAAPYKPDSPEIS